MEKELQKDFEKAIRNRQANDKKYLNQEDVVRALDLAMNTIIKENDALNVEVTE